MEHEHRLYVSFAVGINLSYRSNLLLKRCNPVSTDLRRDVGILGVIIGLAHVDINCQVHMGNMLIYFFKEDTTTTAEIVV